MARFLFLGLVTIVPIIVTVPGGNGQCPHVCPPPPAPAECDWQTEMTCPIMDAFGCYTGDTCMPMQVGECWTMCPMTCPEGDVICPNPTDSMGCDTGSYCMPASEGCPHMCPVPPAPVECNWETEMICPMMDEFGCHIGETCMPMQVGECWSMCPMTCMEGDVLCPNPTDATGCDTGSYCMPASEGCPVQCNWETEMICPMMDALGNHIGDTCIPMQVGECWSMCPMTCMQDDVLCPNPPDAMGCDTGSYCMPASEGCPHICPEPPAPVECDWETEMICPMMDEFGCYLGDTCMPMKSGECWNHCPMTCMEGELTCSSGFDANGCDMGSYCFPTTDVV